MDITTALALACVVTFVGLVVGVVVEYRRWRERQRLLTADWVLRSVASCERSGIGRRSPGPMPPGTPAGSGNQQDCVDGS